MKIKLSQYNLRKAEHTITKVSTPTRKITLEDLAEIYLNSDAIHVMKEDTLPEIVLETKMALTRRRETRKDIMLILQRMMSLPRRESNMKVMNNMF